MKYTARFEHVITASDIKRYSNFNISKASQQELSKHVPFIDYSNSLDLLGLAFDVALVNTFNKNGDGINSMGAIKMKQSLKHKPINIEHNRDIIVGHILEGKFTDTNFKKELKEEDVANSNNPFNITLGGVLYKIVAKDLSKILIDIQEGKETDFSIASSWEVGFDSFFAAVGGDYISECEIIDDESEIESLSAYMKSFGGKGYLNDGRKINRLINPEGELVFLGAGLTKYPAANVGPVYAYNYKDTKKSEDESISHFNKSNVIDLKSKEIFMNKEEIVKLIEEAVASSDSSKIMNQESVANTTAKIADAIIESNKKFIEKKEEAEANLKEANEKAILQEEAISSLQKQIDEASLALNEANKKIEAFEKQSQEALAKEEFNARMSLIDDKFDLSDKDREILASQISAISSNEEFDSFAKNLEVLMSEKLKSTIEDRKILSQEKLKEAVAQELKNRGIVDPMSEKSEELSKQSEIPNNSAEASEQIASIKDKFLNAFKKENIKVTI